MAYLSIPIVSGYAHGQLSGNTKNVSHRGGSQLLWAQRNSFTGAAVSCPAAELFIKFTNWPQSSPSRSYNVGQFHISNHGSKDCLAPYCERGSATCCTR